MLFETAIDGMDYPDGAALHAAQQCRGGLGVPAGALGELTELAAWIAAAQGRFPPRDFQRVRLVVFAG
ncbi:MAG: cobT, partial [Frankiales bacterium]|nr:cobT [Frankiales bacterium]